MRLGGHVDGEVHALQSRPALRLGQQRGDVELAVRGMCNHPVRRAARADAARERARIDARQADAGVLLHPEVEPFHAAEIARVGHILAHDHAERMGIVRLDIVGVRTDIADMREGEGDDLPGKARVGHDLLIAGHRGVEAHLAYRSPFRAKAPPPCDFAIGEHQNAGGSFRRSAGRT